jgi:hypothetical protein
MKTMTTKEEKKMKAIGKTLRELRIEKGYGGYDHFAWENKLSRSSYFKMEQGKSFTLISLMRVLEIHEITLEEFFKKAGI